MENVVCIPKGTIPDGLHLAGFPEFEVLLKKIADARFHALRDKTDMSPYALENNASLRQLITYILVQNGDQIYIYQRTNGTGEKRLAGKYAVPGGHLNCLSANFIEDIIQDSVRELYEELKITPLKQVFYEDGLSCPMKIVALLQNSCIYQDSMVELVHTGIVVKFDVTNRFKIELKEKNKMTNLSLVSPDNINDYIKDAEIWLKLLLPVLPQLLMM